jgi:hypothetical protein
MKTLYNHDQIELNSYKFEIKRYQLWLLVFAFIFIPIFLVTAVAYNQFSYNLLRHSIVYSLLIFAAGLLLLKVGDYYSYKTGRPLKISFLNLSLRMHCIEREVFEEDKVN